MVFQTPQTPLSLLEPSTELYEEYIKGSETYKSQKEFSSDILKCNISEKTIQGVRMYYGLKIKNRVQEGAGFALK